MGAFWKDLPREGKLLLSVIVFEFIGTGLVLPFWVVYLHEVRGFSLPTAGLLLGVQPLAGLLAAGPGGMVIDRFGPRVVLVFALASAAAGQVVMAFASTLGLGHRPGRPARRGLRRRRAHLDLPGALPG